MNTIKNRIELNNVKPYWNERWRKVETKYPTKTSDYYISDYGRIVAIDRTTKVDTLLAGSVTARGHRTLNLRLVEKRRQSIRINKFVALHFLPQPKEGEKFIIHRDNDKGNNHFGNLEWTDQKGLTAWQIENGVYDRANRKKPKHEKMTESKVLLLKKRLKEGRTKKKILARSFGITHTQLNRIEKGENWGHVRLEEE